MHFLQPRLGWPLKFHIYAICDQTEVNYTFNYRSLALALYPGAANDKLCLSI